MATTTTLSSIACPGLRMNLSAATRAASSSRLSVGASSSSNTEATVVIVGGGIAGLATALAFHRLGVRVLVLEQANGLRAGGSIALWKNAWRALDVLGVGDELREKYTLLAGTNVISAEGELLHHLNFSNSSEERQNEVRAVERAALLEALAKPLPDGSIQFGSKVVGVRPAERSSTSEVVLDDGTVIPSKILVGCDGVRSQVAKFIGMREPDMVGQCAIRGVANLAEGHDYHDVLLQFLGRGSRAGVVPISSTKVYWFVSFKCSSGTVVTDTKLVKDEALHYFNKTCRSRLEEFSKLVANSDDDSLSRSSLRDRWSPPLPSSEYSTTLAGDALHPITPNLGQGGCLALEDAVVLARHVYNKAVAGDALSSAASVNRALDEYSRQRWQRYFPLTIKSYSVGFLSMIEFPAVVYLRDKFGVKITLDPGRFLSHTRYDCGELSQAAAKY